MTPIENRSTPQIKPIPFLFLSHPISIYQTTEEIFQGLIIGTWNRATTLVESGLETMRSLVLRIMAVIHRHFISLSRTISLNEYLDIIPNVTSSQRIGQEVPLLASLNRKDCAYWLEMIPEILLRGGVILQARRINPQQNQSNLKQRSIMSTSSTSLGINSTRPTTPLAQSVPGVETQKSAPQFALEIIENYGAQYGKIEAGWSPLAKESSAPLSELTNPRIEIHSLADSLEMELPSTVGHLQMQELAREVGRAKEKEKVQDARLDRLEERFTRMENRMEGIENRMGRVEARTEDALIAAQQASQASQETRAMVLNMQRDFTERFNAIDRRFDAMARAQHSPPPTQTPPVNPQRVALENRVRALTTQYNQLKQEPTAPINPVAAGAGVLTTLFWGAVLGPIGAAIGVASGACGAVASSSRYINEEKLGQIEEEIATLNQQLYLTLA